MKTWPVAVVIFALGMLAAPLSFAQKSESSEPVPKYDVTQEAKFKGVVEEVKDRTCPVSGGMGAHLMVRIDSEIYEVHVAPVKFVKIYEVAFQKGDAIEIVGVKTKVQNIDAILPREIKRGNDNFLFRDEKGKPIW
jgi:hypothetical protein